MIGSNISVHKNCYGIPSLPEGEWLCDACRSHTAAAQRSLSRKRSSAVHHHRTTSSALYDSGAASASATATTASEDCCELLDPPLYSPSTHTYPCALCPMEFGALKRTEDGRWAHVVCALWIPGARVGDVTLMQPIGGVAQAIQMSAAAAAAATSTSTSASASTSSASSSGSAATNTNPNTSAGAGAVVGVGVGVGAGVCPVCKLSYGATISCSHTGCHLQYHPLCAWYHGLFMAVASVGVDCRFYLFCQPHTPPERGGLFRNIEAQRVIRNLARAHGLYCSFAVLCCALLWVGLGWVGLGSRLLVCVFTWRCVQRAVRRIRSASAKSGSRTEAAAHAPSKKTCTKKAWYVVMCSVGLQKCLHLLSLCVCVMFVCCAVAYTAVCGVFQYSAKLQRSAAMQLLRRRSALELLWRERRCAPQHVAVQTVQPLHLRLRLCRSAGAGGGGSGQGCELCAVPTARRRVQTGAQSADRRRRCALGACDVCAVDA